MTVFNNWNCSSGHKTQKKVSQKTMVNNIMRNFDVLPNFPSTRSKTKQDH